MADRGELRARCHQDTLQRARMHYYEKVAGKALPRTLWKVLRWGKEPQVWETPPLRPWAGGPERVTPKEKADLVFEELVAFDPREDTAFDPATLPATRLDLDLRPRQADRRR